MLKRWLVERIEGMDMEKVTVVIPNYNGIRFIGECLDALFQQEENTPRYGVLVVDNGSSDGSLELVKERFPQVRVIALPSNTGFCHAVNVGIRASETPYVILLNNDTKAASCFIRALVNAIEEKPRAFSVSAKMLMWDAPDRVDDAGDRYCVLGWAYARGKGRPAAFFDRPAEVFSACGGAAIYRKSVLEQIGLFDEAHFAYLEDLDVGYRARIAGYENWYCPGAVVYHVGSGTSGSKYNPFKVRLAARNSVYLNYKNMPPAQLLLNALPLAFGYAVKIRFFTKRGFREDYIGGLKEGFRTLNRCRRVRFRAENFWRYVRIEAELTGNTFIYAYEFLKRRIRKV